MSDIWISYRNVRYLNDPTNRKKNIQINAQSGDLNNELVRYSNGGNMHDRWMIS